MDLVRKLILAAAVAAALPAWADVSRDDAAAIAQRVSQGRVLAVERADAGNRPVWRVKIVTAAGEVRVVLIDVATGRPV
ncbi:PepSY domain-containing protein [Ramlibacter alkalitolerans]|uniref:PepSY domain-containing protein n=1 Tax=Ramlibacter alkalitolerans TaxID=2039631 RepID=A0ABS1JRF6_9BURK|nr:PepSY domain-containing protein [Ramlibacter alkalitolerans]MBL0426803.1 PepSY domain-containing protein [Ramlibacter alkalitolerans]